MARKPFPVRGFERFRLCRVWRAALAGIVGLALLHAAACRRDEPRALDPVRALRSRLEPRFQPPADGLLTDAQIDAYLEVRQAMGGRSESEAARAIGVDPREYFWVRSRILEAVNTLDSRRVTEASLEDYARAIAALREARRSAKEPGTAQRLEGEIAALERERASVRKGMQGVSPASLANAAKVAPRRAAIDAAGP